MTQQSRHDARTERLLHKLDAIDKLREALGLSPVSQAPTAVRLSLNFVVDDMEMKCGGSESPRETMCDTLWALMQKELHSRVDDDGNEIEPCAHVTSMFALIAYMVGEMLQREIDRAPMQSQPNLDKIIAELTDEELDGLLDAYRQRTGRHDYSRDEFVADMARIRDGLVPQGPGAPETA